MYDDELMMLMFAVIGLAVIALRQYFVSRRLRKRLDALELRTIQPATHHPEAMLAAPAAPRESDVDALRKRIQVLERIATDGNPVLDREIEELRRAG